MEVNFGFSRTRHALKEGDLLIGVEDILVSRSLLLVERMGLLFFEFGDDEAFFFFQNDADPTGFDEVIQNRGGTRFFS